jgi:hypothetical protein
VYPELTSQRVLVTGWVNGEKLTESRAPDVRQLCSTLLNCYLIQLLETGLLHADPHPGNLMRTPDGRAAHAPHAALLARARPAPLLLPPACAQTAAADPTPTAPPAPPQAASWCWTLGWSRR